MPDEEWPDAASGQRDIIMSDFAPGVGDRRQEIVFIGAGMDEVSKEGHAPGGGVILGMCARNWLQMCNASERFESGPIV